ncbi:MAG: helix-turn-helix domain-containing protein, partial [Patescibacteria group bacterium]
MVHILIKDRENVSALRQAIKRSQDEAQKTRIRALLALKEGKTRTAVAKQLVVSRTSLISWIVLYNKGGVEALKLGSGGRPEGNPKWDALVFEKLAQEIDKGGYWSIPRMQEWLKEHS